MDGLEFIEKTHTYLLNGVKIPSCSEIIRDAGLVDYSHVNPAIMDAASKFGEAVHLACALDDKGILDRASLSEPIVPYLKGWQNFLTDYEVAIIPEWIERRVASVKWRFGVTPDRFVMLPKGFGIIEIKTTTTMQRAVAIQTACQKIAVEETTGVKIRKRYAVKLDPDAPANYRIEEYKDPSDETVFRACLTLYNWKRRTK